MNTPPRREPVGMSPRREPVRTPSPRRRIVHLIVQGLLLAAAAVNLFFAAVVVTRAWWLSLVFLVAAVVTVLGVTIEKARWLVTGAVVSIAASAIAIRLRSPVDDHQPLTTAVIAVVLIGAWWVSRPHFVRRFPSAQG